MKAAACALSAALVLAGAAGAHTLDQYVQAMRVGVGRGELELHLDLTPGANIAAAVIRRVDANADGVFTPDEAEAYARAVIADLDVRLDNAPLPLSLVRVEVAAAAEMNEGLGVIRIALAAPVSGTRGAHRLEVYNGHLPSLSVYLANALQPDDATTRVVRQTRDPRQQTFWLDYETRGGADAAVGWLMLTTVGLASLVVMRRRHRGDRTPLSLNERARRGHRFAARRMAVAASMPDSAAPSMKPWNS